jgi:hypothetical protein
VAYIALQPHENGRGIRTDTARELLVGHAREKGWILGRHIGDGWQGIASTGVDGARDVLHLRTLDAKDRLLAQSRIGSRTPGVEESSEHSAKANCVTGH